MHPLFAALAVAALFLAACSGPSPDRVEEGPSESKALGEAKRGSERVVLEANIDDTIEDVPFNAYYPMGDYHSGLTMRVVQIREGNFPQSYLHISTHSGTMLERFMLKGYSPNTPVEVVLRWDNLENLYRVEAFKPVPRRS
jgi:hypothetical protein